MNERLKRDADAVRRVLTHYAEQGIRAAGVVWTGDNEAEIGDAVWRIFFGIDAANEAFQSVADELAKQQRELHELRQRLDAYPALAGRHDAYNLDLLDELAGEIRTGTEVMNLLAERLVALEQRNNSAPGAVAATTATGLADTILAYLRAREKRAAIEGALQQARQREQQLAADVRRLAPGPGMYRVGDEHVVVSPDEVNPAAAPVEVER